MRVLVSDDAGRGALCSPTPPRATGCERGCTPLALSPGGVLSVRGCCRRNRLGCSDESSGFRLSRGSCSADCSRFRWRGAWGAPLPYTPSGTGCERGYAPLALSPVGCSIGKGLLPTEQVGMFWWMLRFPMEQVKLLSRLLRFPMEQVKLLSRLLRFPAEQGKLFCFVRISDDAGRGALRSPTPPRGRGARGDTPLSRSPQWAVLSVKVCFRRNRLGCSGGSSGF